MNKKAVLAWDALEPLAPAYALVGEVDLVVIRWPDEEQVSVLYGRCLHRGALMANGRIEGPTSSAGSTTGTMTTAPG